ncbi:porin family protein [Flavobacterium solisilvae]|uniref:PorT family protein n=1 Tax=Flavobacterium solisilvae TaxID=1852019 RepID=A0ABX1QRQ8_9FLAO|nr:porin family protein [Flavobacterium solisilvae]NMH24949.1 PorT family protein [Flavobacterium solisilvae]
MVNSFRFLVLLFLVSTVTFSQEKLSYGVVLGGLFHTAANNNSQNTFSSLDNNISFNYGVYGEYAFNKNLGLKVTLALSNRDLTYRANPLQIEYLHKISFVEFSPLLKYDFGQEYRKGFYMFLGPKINFITKATSEGEDVKDNLETTVFSAQYGIGTRIAKYIDLQATFDYGVTPFFKMDNGNKSNFFGVYFGVGIDLERIINK